MKRFAVLTGLLVTGAMLAGAARELPLVFDKEDRGAGLAKPHTPALAAREVWQALGVADRMGATEEDTPHCRWHEGFTSDLEAYLDRFMLGRKDGRSTDILRSKFTALDRGTWIPWQAPALR